MSGGVNPLEWIMPPVAISHHIVDAAAKAGNVEVPATPGSPDALQREAAQDQQAMLDEERQRASQRILDTPRPQTAQEEYESRKRAAVTAEKLGGGKRRASQYLTDPGMSLAGVYP